MFLYTESVGSYNKSVHNGPLSPVVGMTLIQPHKTPLFWTPDMLRGDLSRISLQFELPFK